MTGPAPVGYPDWQRTYAGSRKVIFNQQNVVYSINTPYAPVVTANTHHIGISASCTGAPLSLSLTWYFDAAQTIILSQDYIEIAPVLFFDQTIAVKGPFLVIVVGRPGGGTATATIVMYETDSAAISQHDRNGNMLFATTSQSVAAGTSPVFPFNRVYAGPIAFMAYSDNGSIWNTNLITQYGDGSSKTLLHTNPSVPLQNWNTYLPPVPCAVQFVNADGVARNFIATVLGKPIYP